MNRSYLVNVIKFIFVLLFINTFSSSNIIHIYKEHSVYYLKFVSNIEKDKFDQIYLEYESHNSKYKGQQSSFYNDYDNCFIRIPYLGTDKLKLVIPEELYPHSEKEMYISYPDKTNFFRIEPNAFNEVHRVNDSNKDIVLEIELANELSFHDPITFVFKILVLLIVASLTTYYLNLAIRNIRRLYQASQDSIHEN